MLDKSVYCIDLLCKLAKENPQYRFLLIGRGNYFEINKKPENITWGNKYLSQSEMPFYINMAKHALMLSRRDTQGVMACEFATYGIPLIVSDISISREIFAECPRVRFIKNEELDLRKATGEADGKVNGRYKVYREYQDTEKRKAKKTNGKWDRYFSKNTMAQELSLM